MNISNQNHQKTLKQILCQNQNHPQIKQTLKLLCQTRQKIAYHALISTSQTYLQVRGLATTANYDQFNFINKMLHSKIIGVVGKIKRQQISVRNLHQEYVESHQPQIIQANQQIIKEIEHVINNIDLPISLFKRNDQYWYPDNPKTHEAKQFVHARMKQERQHKKAIRKQQSKRKQQRQKLEMQNMEKYQKMEEQKKKQMKANLQKKIQDLKKAKSERKRIISESQKLGSSLKPLFKKIEQEQHQNRFKALQQQKRRLSDIRKLHQSIDLTEIQERSNKIEEYHRGKQLKKIVNQPLKVHYKSKYHTSMTNRSRVEYETTQSLAVKKKQYGEIVRNQFKPDINENLVQQMQERMKLMRRKRTRKDPSKKNKNKKRKNDEDEDEDDSEQSQAEQSRIVENTHKNAALDDSDMDLDSDQQDASPPKRVRGQDEDPDRQQRYELGVQYLQYVRNLRKKKKQQSAAKLISDKEQQQKLSRYQNANGAGHQSHYKDYLRQFVQPINRNTIDHIDTSRLKFQNTKNVMGTDYLQKNRLQNTARTIQIKARNQQQLLKFKKLGNDEAIEKRVEIDDAMVQTIKARLSMMG